MLQSIWIVPAGTSHTGNMGSVARAMETMRLTNLWLVNPPVKPDSQAIVLVVGAGNVVDNTHIVDTLDEALAGCSLVMGTNARSRTLPWPMFDPRKCGLKSVAETASTPVALVFGREHVGLTNEELQKCRCHVTITTNPEYSSLNLAMAVRVIVYEVHVARLTTQEDGEQIEREETPYLLVGNLERFYGHLEQALLTAGFIREGHPGQVMNKLRRLSIRAHSESQELSILRGILASIEQ